MQTPCTTFSECRQMHERQVVHSRECLGGRLDGISGTLGFPLEPRVSLMLTTMLIAAVGVSRTLFQRLLGGWSFALAFRREVSCSFSSMQTVPRNSVRYRARDSVPQTRLTSVRNDAFAHHTRGMATLHDLAQ